MHHLFRITVFWRIGLFALVLACLGLTSDLGATVVRVEYFDQGYVNPEFAGGPLWTGYVDTLADTLTIVSWQELPLHGEEFWIPKDIESNPLVWHARDASGGYFDVPDSFDGHIDSSFAFISDLHLGQMSWEKPIFDYTAYDESIQNGDETITPPTFLGTVDVEYTLDTGDVWPGWGGFALQENVPGVGIEKVFRTAEYDETVLPAWPIEVRTTGDVTYTLSDDAIVTAEVVDLDTYPTGAVPEARQWLCIIAVLLVTVVGHQLSTRRQLRLRNLH